MKRYDISTYVSHTTSWGEPCAVAKLSVKEAEGGQWVKAEDLPKWIKCTDRLPDEGQYVLVRVLTERDYRDRDGSRVRVMKIFKGLTAEERKAEELKTGHSRPYGNSDQHENNLVPYKWQDAGACNSFGQEVTHWQPLPEPPTDD